MGAIGLGSKVMTNFDFHFLQAFGDFSYQL